MRYEHLNNDLSRQDVALELDSRGLPTTTASSPGGYMSTVTLDRPRYFFVIKYSLLTYIILHMIWITVTLPGGMRELRQTDHEHREQILALWITSIVYSGITSIAGFIGIWKENFAICFIYCISMVINLVLLVYAALLHLDQGTTMIEALIINWFFTGIVIAFTKILDSMQRSSGRSVNHLLESSPGYLHSIYIRREPKDLHQQQQQQIPLQL